ncbi:hypothetical protein Nepgr_028206 [Nepenthes gracilis]|uniref:GIR1-like zinc ribbon domain-containing protein n=1 Tax=Nepenthes gracilis TaxID=150966 RepID=A0AAD3TBX0_NEPGR|nr:hypothetical protein Nepgr_028206 [Nepenthes gracilis]
MAVDVENQPPHQSLLVSGGAATSGGPSGGVALTHLPRRPPPPVTLNLFDTKEFKHPSPLKTKEGENQSWKNIKAIMDPRNRNDPKLDLKLNLLPSRGSASMALESPSRSAPASPMSSCVSSDEYSSSPEAIPMVLVGCPRCFMYVMLSEKDPRCPKCKSTVLLNFLHNAAAAAPATTSAAKKTRKS